MSGTRSWPVHGGIMGERIRTMDWSRTPLGPAERWPQSLRTAVDICLGSAFPGFVWWGPELIQLHNDAALPLRHARHPEALGGPAREVWSDAWATVGPLFQQVLTTGEAATSEDLPLAADRHGAPGEGVFTVCFSALRDADGRIAGVTATAVETLDRARAVAARAESGPWLWEEAGLSAGFRALFEASPSPLLAVAPPDFTCVAVNDAYLRVTGTARADILGRSIPELFPDDPAEPGATGARGLRASLERVLATGRADVMEIQRYDLPRQDADGKVEERWWSLINSPMHDPGGKVVAILHQVEEVTGIVRPPGGEPDQRRIIHERQSVVDRLREASQAIVRAEEALRESERQRAEEALRASEERNRLVVENARDYAILITDPEGRIESWSPGAEAVFGWTAEQAVGQDVAMTFIPEDRARGEPEQERLTARRDGIALDVRWHQRSDGGRIFIEGVARPLDDGAGGVRGFLKIGQDVTRQREMEEALRFRGEQFRTLLDRAPIGVYLVDADFRVRQINPMAQAAFGDIPGGIVDRDIGEVSHILWGEELAEELVARFRHTLATGEPHVAAEHARFRADRGDTEFYRWRIDRIPLPDGRHGVVCYFQDISEQVRARLAIAASEARYRTLFNSMDEGFCVLEPIPGEQQRPVDYRFVEANPAVERQTGLRNVLGRTIREIVPGAEPFWFDAFARVAATGEPTRFVGYTATLQRWFDVNAVRIGEPQERRVAVLFNDITERKRVEAELRELNESLEQRVAARTSELAEAYEVISREHGERLLAEEARREVLRLLVTTEEDERRRISQELHDQMGQQVTALLLGLRALERVSGSPEERQAGIRKLERLAEEIARDMQSMALELRPPALDNLGLQLALQGHVEEWSSRHGIDVSAHFAGMRGIRLSMELETTLYRVVQEGLTNILKHAEASHVSLILERRRGQVSAILEDNGKGFEVEAVERSAEKAKRLGLRGMRERVALLGGRLEIESSPGAGTTLFVRIPDASHRAAPRTGK